MLQSLEFIREGYIPHKPRFLICLCLVLTASITFFNSLLAGLRLIEFLPTQTPIEQARGKHRPRAQQATKPKALKSQQSLDWIRFLGELKDYRRQRTILGRAHYAHKGLIITPVDYVSHRIMSRSSSPDFSQDRS